MRGTVLAFDRGMGWGLLLDSEGERRKFVRNSWRSPGEPRVDAVVDFEPGPDGAGEIYLIAGDARSVGVNALIFGILSLVLSVISVFIGNLGVVTVLLALVFGFIGISAGRDLPDRTAYRLSWAGVGVSALSILVVLALLGVLSRVLSPPREPSTITIEAQSPDSPINMPPHPSELETAVNSYGSPENRDASDPRSRPAQQGRDMAALAEGLQRNPSEDEFLTGYQNAIPTGTAGRMVRMTHTIRVNNIEQADLDNRAPSSHLDEAVRLYGADAVRPGCKTVLTQRTGYIELEDGGRMTLPQPRVDFGIACLDNGRFRYLELR